MIQFCYLGVNSKFYFFSLTQRIRDVNLKLIIVI